ncbi:16S rRNA (guanine(966)-N(2))-methyltransferase RsmD [SAR202 cluster bacterium AC-409-J13_OGT_754m]|nr:16S rRNA (guanine(966)-N(2))-methyltransferase RsmD [SAR202 cluster bacterium AC-409-J13_OGT_754m]
MRVVGGIARGRKLAPPAIGGARPTSALVRGAIFNVLGFENVEGRRIIDLYAGVGSLGVEGISRGAHWVDFVEKDPKQCAVIRANLKSTGLAGRSRVYCMTAERALEVLEGPYNLVLMDPPYKMKDLSSVLTVIGETKMLEADGMVVVGHSKHSDLSDTYGSLLRFDSRRYGDSMVEFYQGTKIV